MPDQSSAATEHAILQEITQPLNTLPDDPLAVVNAEFSTALRGYDRVAVDDYVRQTRQLVADLQATRSPEAAVRRALERVGEQISGILQRAHETAEQITAQSRSEAEDRLEQARGEAAQVAEAAEQRVRDLDADTDRIWLERERIVADAEDLAGQLLALAKTAAERFPADAQADAGRESGAQAHAGDGEHGDGAAGGSDAMMPYDDEVATQAMEPSFAAEDEDDDFVAPEVRDDSEIERTMAFEPLERTGAEAEGSQAAPSPAGADAEGAGGSPSRLDPADSPPATQSGSTGAGATDADTTAVIPPASQAANRRMSR
jgi:DivIVA domain-containing protein